MLLPQPVLTTLIDLCGGAVHLPGDPGYAAGAQGLSPLAVAYPGDEAEVSELVAFAHRHGLRVAVQRTAMGCRPMSALHDAILLRTAGMSGVRVEAGLVRVQAGALWGDVVDAVGDRLVPVPDDPRLGVVGSTLEGGIGTFGRLLGLASSRVVGARVVLASGDAREADEDLLWAVRGGGPSAAVVTELVLATAEARTLSLWTAQVDPDEAVRLLRDAHPDGAGVTVRLSDGRLRADVVTFDGPGEPLSAGTVLRDLRSEHATTGPLAARFLEHLGVDDLRTLARTPAEVTVRLAGGALLGQPTGARTHTSSTYLVTSYGAPITLGVDAIALPAEVEDRLVALRRRIDPAGTFVLPV
ncbi:FAD-binding oxidoreductase [Cellulomonas sp. URHD0024]|uniref:FAD-binding oxidoreductase n=1 Tax=Cellulomonas sp. URHD0024 TaxID=1302620 RepID=UPI000420B801|nr:FAD-binding protein [Cellulomonas sp. URHD0024]